MRMTNEQIAIAKAILNEDNLKSLGFIKCEDEYDKYGGDTYQYKNFPNIKIVTFMGIKTLEFKLFVCDFIETDMLRKLGINDTLTQYCIYDRTNRDESVRIDIHSNEELISICKRWAEGIKKVGALKAKKLIKYYNSL